MKSNKKRSKDAKSLVSRSKDARSLALRYVIVMDYYISAKSDKKALKKAQKIASKMNRKLDCCAKVTEIHQNEFGKFQSRLVYEEGRFFQG